MIKHRAHLDFFAIADDSEIMLFDFLFALLSAHQKLIRADMLLARDLPAQYRTADPSI